MIVFAVPARDLGKFERGLARQLRLGQQRVLREVGREAVQNLREKSADIKDLGAFQSGWSARALFTRLEVWNRAPHAVFVEMGRRAGATPPPVAAIVGWVIRHLGDANLAYVVARAIGRRGIKARPVLTAPGTLPELAQLFVDRLSKFWDEAAARAR